MKKLSLKSITEIKPAILLWLIGLFLLVTTAAVYSPVRHHEFINFDDGEYVYSNKNVQQGLTLEAIRWAFTLVKPNADSYWHPVTWLSHMLDCQLFGLEPGPHHLSNLFFHLANVLLLFLALFRMTGTLWRSAMAAALFALHPVNVESVAWIAERKNLLSTTFWMLTLLAYIRYAARPSVWRYVWIMLVFTMGLMAKPMLVTLPCALLLLDFWPLHRCRWINEHWLAEIAMPSGNKPVFRTATLTRLIFEKIPLMGLSFGAMALSFVSLQKNSHVVNEVVRPMGLRIANALASYLHYLWKMIWPSDLAVFYPFPNAIPIWQPIIAAFALIVITLIVVALSRQKPYLATGWFWYAGTLTPVIGIIQGGLWPQISDRWAYIPYVGLFVLLTWGAADLIKKSPWGRRLSAGLAAVILVILFLVTHAQLKHWKTSESLFRHTLNITEQNFLAHGQIGSIASAKGNHEEAIGHFQKALSISPYYSEAHESLGDEHVFLKNHEAALNAYQTALMLDPSEVGLYNKIGNVFVQKGAYNQAAGYFRDAVTLSPNNPTGYNNLGVAYLYSGNIEQARQYLEKTISLAPDNAEAWYNFGLVSLKTGNTAKAATSFNKAVALNPNYAEAYNSLGKIHFQAGDFGAALASFQNLARISPQDAQAHYNVGIILYNQQKIPEAAQHFQKALAIDPEYEKAKKALQMTEN